MESGRQICILFAQEILELGCFAGVRGFLPTFEHLGNSIDLSPITPRPQGDLLVLKQLLHEFIQVRTQHKESTEGRLGLELVPIGNQRLDRLFGML